MQINTKLSDSQLDAIVDAMGCELIGDKTGCILRPMTGRDDYRSANSYGRRLWACSWAGHYVFMRAVFHLDPAAKIRSAIVRYDGLDDFNENALATRGKGFQAQAKGAEAPDHVLYNTLDDLTTIAVQHAEAVADELGLVIA